MHVRVCYCVGVTALCDFVCSSWILNQCFCLSLAGTHRPTRHKSLPKSSWCGARHGIINPEKNHLQSYEAATQSKTSCPSTCQSKPSRKVMRGLCFLSDVVCGRSRESALQLPPLACLSSYSMMCFCDCLPPKLSQNGPENDLQPFAGKTQTELEVLMTFFGK